jgi:ketosteroid isomerase-like protein
MTLSAAATSPPSSRSSTQRSNGPRRSVSHTTAAPGRDRRRFWTNLKPLSSEWDGFSAKPHEFIAEDDRVVALGTYSGKFKKTGKSFSAAFAHVWTVRSDKLARFDMHTDTAKVLEAVNA